MCIKLLLISNSAACFIIPGPGLKFLLALCNCRFEWTPTSDGKLRGIDSYDLSKMIHRNPAPLDAMAIARRIMRRHLDKSKSTVANVEVEITNFFSVNFIIERTFDYLSYRIWSFKTQIEIVGCPYG